MKYFLSILLLFIISFIAEAQTSYARKGVLDLRQYNFNQDGNINLSGEWELFMTELVAPEAFDKQLEKPGDLVAFPSTWNENSKSLNPGQGYATYHLKLIVKPQTYALELPHFYSNYKLWINKQPIASNGQVGISLQTAKPQWLPKIVTFVAEKDTLDFVIQVSNFHHAKGGVRENLILGIPKEISFKRELAVTSNLILSGGLIVIALGFIFIYFFVKHDSASLFFAALCITWALRSAFSNLYIVTSYFPEFPWELSVKIEYITLFSTMIWGVFFLASLFPVDVNNLFKYFFLAFNLIFIAFTLCFDASWYTQFLPVYLSFCVMLLIFVVYVLIHALVNERPGVWFIMSSILIGVIVFGYDLVSYQGWASYNSVITNFGYLGIFMLMSICLFYQFGLLKRDKRNSDVLTYEDLYGVRKK